MQSLTIRGGLTLRRWFDVWVRRAARRAGLGLPWTTICVVLLTAGATTARAWDHAALAALKPVRESTLNLGDQGPAGQGQALELVFKHYALPGAQPILMVPGIASNDRVWDSAVPEASLARRLRQAGFDVWLGNYRHSGTPGFRSETPPLPYHWTVEDEAVFDLPALIEKVRSSTAQRPFIVGHSLSAWVIEGYLAGLEYGADGRVHPNRALGRARQAGLKGVVTVSGVYNLWWPKALKNALFDPVLSREDYYRSNYELEALARTSPLYDVASPMPSLPLSWIGDVLTLPLERIPWIGPVLADAYRHFQDAVIDSPVLSMFYFASNTPAEVVRLHGVDGLEEFGPHLLEQLGNGIVQRQTTSYYHGDRPADAYVYASVRKDLRLPLLFIAGDHDRLANADVIHDDGYALSASADKQYWRAEGGHLDVISGRRSDAEVAQPLVQWFRARQ